MKEVQNCKYLHVWEIQHIKENRNNLVNTVHNKSNPLFDSHLKNLYNV